VGVVVSWQRAQLHSRDPRAQEHPVRRAGVQECPHRVGSSRDDLKGEGHADP
jgi:hypothetical protein